MNMRRLGIHILSTVTALLITGVATADNSDQGDGIKELQGISIKADKEAPRSLYIVPWHDSELKQNTRLSSSLVDDSLQAIDQNSLQRELRLHELSRSGWYRLTPVTQ